MIDFPTVRTIFWGVRDSMEIWGAPEATEAHGIVYIRNNERKRINILRRLISSNLEFFMELIPPLKR